MSRYDGLIIPRSYSEYINKTDAATLQQALQLSGVLSGAVAAGDNKAVKSSAVANLITKEERIFSSVTEKLDFPISNGHLHILYSSYYSGRGLFIFVLPQYNGINIINNYSNGFVVEDKTSETNLKIEISLATWNTNIQKIVHIIL